MLLSLVFGSLLSSKAGSGGLKSILRLIIMLLNSH